MATILCPHCGGRTDASNRHCSRCGVTLYEDQQNAEPPAQESASPGQPIGAAANEAEAEPSAIASPSAQGALDAGQVGAAAVEPIDGDAEKLPPAPKPAVLFPDERMSSEVTALLEPVQVSGAGFGSDAAIHVLPLPPSDINHLRALRTIMATEPMIASSLPVRAPRPYSYRTAWVTVLLLLALLLAFTRPSQPLASPPHRWPGVQAAYEQIQQIPPGSRMIVLWAYDASSAGEMDLVALPVVTHLVERSITLDVISLLPGGPAVGRRLLARANGLPPSLDSAALAAALPAGGVFLAGGASVLPLVGQDRPNALNKPAARLGAEATYQLALVFAAQADDVQEWLEQVQPFDGLPVVAVTGAGADPLLRPYLDSGQLSGLVSGFDGASAYQELRAHPLSDSEAELLLLHTRAQNWGALALVTVLILGSLAGFMARGQNE